MATTTSLRRRSSVDALPKRRLLRRWGLALRLVAICLALMLILAALQGASCALSAPQRLCVEIPIAMFYALHAAAIAFSLWAVFGAVAELFDARRRRFPSASRTALHR